MLSLGHLESLERGQGPGGPVAIAGEARRVETSHLLQQGRTKNYIPLMGSFPPLPFHRGGVGLGFLAWVGGFHKPDSQLSTWGTQGLCQAQVMSQGGGRGMR